MVELRKRKAHQEPPTTQVKKTKATEKTATTKTARKNATPPAAPTVAAPETSTKVPKIGDSLSLDGFGGEVETHEGVKTTLKQLVEESKAGVVLFTYPKASTPGCMASHAKCFLLLVLIKDTDCSGPRYKASVYVS